MTSGQPQGWPLSCAICAKRKTRLIVCGEIRRANEGSNVGENALDCQPLQGRPGLSRNLVPIDHIDEKPSPSRGSTCRNLRSQAPFTKRGPFVQAFAGD